MKISISKDGPNSYTADRPEMTGSPTVGRGRTPLEALGAFFWHANPTYEYVYFTLETIALIRDEHPDNSNGEDKH